VGGFGDVSGTDIIKDIWQYNLSDNKWSIAASPPTYVGGPAFLYNNKIFIGYWYFPYMITSPPVLAEIEL